MLLHIHGFNSSPASNTFHMLRAVFPHARALAYPCDGLFADNLAALHAEATELYQQASGGKTLGGQALAGKTSGGNTLGGKVTDADKQTLGGAARVPLVISGSSLGGFYASQLAALLYAEGATAPPCHCALFNPVVYPAKALRPLLGRNILFHSGVEWEFTQAMLESYAHFADTRACGKNGASGKSGGNCGQTLRRFVLLGRNDSLLNPDEARAYWQCCAQIHETDDEHSLAALDAVTVAVLREWGAGA